jgi:hypothetical protein
LRIIVVHAFPTLFAGLEPELQRLITQNKAELARVESEKEDAIRRAQDQVRLFVSRFDIFV